MTVSYYRNDGNLVKSVNYNLPGWGILSIYNGGSSSDIPSGFVGAAAISSSDSPLIMAVNESGGGGARQSEVYLAASSGASSVGLPVMAKNGLGYTTGATILNTSNQAGQREFTILHQEVAKLLEDFCSEAIITPEGHWYTAANFGEKVEGRSPEKLAIEWFWQSAHIISRYQQCWAYCID